MKIRRIANFATMATLASVAAIAAPAMAYQVITPTTDERGYVAKWDPAVQGKTREQVKAELADARASNPNAVRLGVFPTPRPEVVADSAAVHRQALEAARLQVGPHYRN